MASSFSSLSADLGSGHLCMADSEIFDVPMELGLELVAAISTDLADRERELVMM